jgi:hypothetical protein
MHMRRKDRPQRLLRDRYGGSYLPMVVALTVLFLVGPSLSGHGLLAALAIASLQFIVAFVSVRGASDDRAIIWKVVAIALVALTIQIAGDEADSALVLFAGRFMVVGVLMYIHTLIILDILPDPRVTISTIFGSVGTYMLSILYWATVFSAIQRVVSDAFTGAIEADSSVMDFMYFSMITQTTVGYGDITPVNPLVRSLAGLEAVTGQLYVAIIVAWLVGRAIARQGSQELILGGDPVEVEPRE